MWTTPWLGSWAEQKREGELSTSICSLLPGCRCSLAHLLRLLILSCPHGRLPLNCEPEETRPLLILLSGVLTPQLIKVMETLFPNKKMNKTNKSIKGISFHLSSRRANSDSTDDPHCANKRSIGCPGNRVLNQGLGSPALPGRHNAL